MNFKATFKRICAVTVAVATVTSSFVFMPTADVEAAGAYSVNFKDNIADPDKLSRDAIIVEGITINTVTNAPEKEYSFIAPPYTIAGKNEEESADIIGVSTERAITGIKPNPTGEPYTIDPNFSAFVTKATIASAKIKDGASADRSLAISATTLGTRDISLTSSGNINLTVLAGRTEADGTISFSNAVTDGGLYEAYDNAEVATTSFIGDKLNITLERDGKTLSFEITGKFPDKIDAGSTIRLFFERPSLGQLQLTILSKQAAVDNIAKEIATTNNFEYFVKLAQGDSANTITKQFNLLQNEKRYNNKEGFNIKWTWDQETDGDDVITIAENTPPELIMVPVKIIQQVQNVSGTLKASVSYTIKKNDGATDVTKSTDTIVSSYKVTVLGTGTPPYVKPLNNYKGETDIKGNYKETSEAITLTSDKLGGSLDVNQGRAHLFPSKEPFKQTGQIYFGTGTRTADKIKIDITSAGNGKVKTYINNSTTPYISGTMIPNPGTTNNEGDLSVGFVGEATGKVNIKISFYNKDGVDFDAYNFTYSISDSSPIKDASMKEIRIKGITINEESDLGTEGEDDDFTQDLKEYQDRFKLVYPDGIIPIADFDPNKMEYNIIVPWAVEKIDLTPLYKEAKGGLIEVMVGGVALPQKLSGYLKVLPDTAAGIELSETGVVTIFINGIAQDKSTTSQYKLVITRAPRSDVASLAELNVTTEDGKKQVLTPVFDPITFGYSLTLPYEYSGKNVTVEAIPYGDWGALPTFTVTGADATPPKNGFSKLIASIFRKSSKTVKPIHKIDAVTGEKVPCTVVVNVQSEDKKKNVDYTLTINIEDPNENNELKGFDIYVGKSTTPAVLDDGTIFSKQGREYYLTIPYKTEELKFDLLPDEEKALKVKAEFPRAYPPSGADNPIEKEYKKKGTPITIISNVKFNRDAVKDPAPYMNFDYKFEVQAQSGAWTEEPYVLHIKRSEPSEVNTLAKLDLEDVSLPDAKKPIDTYKFNPLIDTYDISVPYDTSIVSVTPVATKPEFTAVTIGKKTVSEATPSIYIDLVAGKVTKIEVVVLPEAGEKFKKIYTLNITRQAPNTEARLIKLEVGGSDKMVPDPFVPSTTSYTFSIPRGTASYTITATPVDPKSTITINGKNVANGAASEAIFSLAPTSSIPVVVTAQDGKTKMTYTVNIRDYNLINKSSNADLSNLKVNYADLAPKFKSSIDEYELYVKPETDSLDITPIPASSTSTMEVFVGSKKITPYGGVYSSSLFINKTTFTINVVAEDLTEKTYKVDVFRNDKKKQGAFKPISADMVDYEKSNPIIIDISNYAVVEAGVFNKLKTNYPDKSILFTGNDYTMKITGKDIVALIPHTTQYDFNFSFTTPDQSVIQSLLYEDAYDWDIDPVYLYFDDHGPLPAKMILTVSLGREYRNKTMYWNYYNDERERIDYYGYMNTNAKGTFSVPITHLSTYMPTTIRIRTAEDKTGTNFGGVDDSGLPGGGSGNGNANGSASGDKTPPKTGVSHGK